MQTVRLFLVAAIVVALAAVIIVLTLLVGRTQVTESTVRTVIVETLTGEEPAAFLVTGTLFFATEVNRTSEKKLLPGILDISLGSTTATVRAPGRAAYGFDAAELRDEDITLSGDTVFISYPRLEVFAVEPDLEQIEQRVDVGWARLYRSSGQATALLAIQQLQPAMRARAESFLRTADYPRKHTEAALRRILTPAIRATGIDEPIFVFNSIVTTRPTG